MFRVLSSLYSRALRDLQENHDVKILFEYWPYGLQLLAMNHRNCCRSFRIWVSRFGRWNQSGKMGMLGSTKEDYCNLIAERA